MRVLIVTALITALIGGLCVGGALWAIQRGELEGSGTIVTEDRPAAGVTGVEIDGPGRLVIVQGQTEGLSIRTDDNILETIDTEIDGGTLEISYDRGELTTLSRIKPTDEIRFDLTVKTLETVEVNGTADVEIAGLQGDRLEIDINGLGDARLDGLDVDELEVSIDGSSTIDVAGTADVQTIEINGDGSYRAANLATRETAIEVNGDGEATVRVRETLDVEVSGRGKVEYIGSPRITQDISGDGEIEQIGDTGGAATPSATPAGAPAATPAATPRATDAAPATPTQRSLLNLPTLRPTRPPEAE